MDGTDELAKRICSRHEQMRADRSTWDQLWDGAARYIMPRKGDIVTKNTPGQEQTDQLYDTTAEESALIGAAGLLSQLVPPGEPWFRYEPARGETSTEVKAWLDQCTETALNAIYASNFYLAIHEDFLDALVFGTSDTYIEEGESRLLNFVNIPVGTFCISEDNEGMVDTVYREWQWTARQIEQQWPDAKLPKVIADCLASNDAKDWDRKFTIIHAVYPRRKGEWKEGRVDGKRRKFASVYVCKEAQSTIEEGGFYEKPHAVSRLLRSNNEIYGRGPGIQVLPEIKVLNRMELDLLLATEKHVNPSWLMPEDSAFRPDNRPNGITYWDATNPNGKPERIQETSRVDLGEMKTDQKRARIRAAFFVDMFQMLNAPGVKEKEMTAREVAERIREKLVLFSPMFARLVQEKLNPLLERVFNVIMRNGGFPPPPAGVESLNYEISYTSKIALALKAASDAALLEVVDVAALLQPFDQSVPKMVNWRKAYKNLIANRGLPASVIRSDDEVDEMVRAEMEAAQAQQAAAMAEQAAGAVQKLGPDAQRKASAAIAA